jgi:uncharacterized protein (TIGR02246 family)
MDDDKALRELIRDYQKFINTGDAQKYSALYTDDAIWMPPNSPDRIGRAEILKTQSATFAKFTTNTELTPTEVRLLSDQWGLVLCSSRGKVTPRGEGNAVEFAYSIVFLMARQPDRSWLIACQMWNQKPKEVGK